MSNQIFFMNQNVQSCCKNLASHDVPLIIKSDLCHTIAFNLIIRLEHFWLCDLK